MVSWRQSVSRCVTLGLVLTAVGVPINGTVVHASEGPIRVAPLAGMQIPEPCRLGDDLTPAPNNDEAANVADDSGDDVEQPELGSGIDRKSVV